VSKRHLAIVSPTTVNRTVTPLRRPNAELRTREHLTPSEVESLIEAAKSKRYGHRDATMVLLAYRHGLRACELVDLEWSQVDFKAAVLHVRRAKKGTPSTHPLRGEELRALRKLLRESPASSYVFVSERGSPFTPAGFAKMVERAGAEAGFDFKAHPHMLRHACGFALHQCRSRYPRAAGLSRSPQYPAHGALHRAGAGPVQGFPAVAARPLYPRKRTPARAHETAALGHGTNPLARESAARGAKRV
jgi:integrase